MLNIIRNNRGKIISVDGYKKNDIVVFDRSIGGYSDCYFKIKNYFEDKTGDIIVRTEIGFSLIDDFFSTGYRKPTVDELKYMK